MISIDHDLFGHRVSFTRTNRPGVFRGVLMSIYKYKDTTYLEIGHTNGRPPYPVPIDVVKDIKRIV